MDTRNSGPSSDLNGFGPRRRSTIRFVLSVAVALAAAVSLYLLQPGWFAAPVTAVPKTGPTAVPSPTPKPKPVTYPYLGDTERVDNVWLTPLDVSYTRGSGANQANMGDVYAIVTMRIENHRGQDYGFVPNTNCLIQLCNFYVHDSQGEKNPPVAFDPYHTHLRAVVMQDGGHQVGSVTFEVPAHDAEAHSLQLLYYHDPFADANSVVHWQLQYLPRHGR